MVSVGEPNIDERLATVGRFIDTIAPANAIACAGLSGAHPDNVGVGLKDTDITDVRSAVIFENRRPRCSSVSRLPHTS